jgi:hypothetical protein
MMSDKVSHSRTEILDHLWDVCFGYGKVTESELRALKLADRIAVLNKARENADPFMATKLAQWHGELEQASMTDNVQFFRDVARAHEYLKKEKTLPKLDASAPEGAVTRLAAWTAFRMIESRPQLPFRDELIWAVEHQLATHKFIRSPLAPPLPPGPANTESAVQDELKLLRMRRRKKELNWPRILKRLWLFDFLPTRRHRTAA